MKIKKLIETKINEHQIEITGCVDSLESIQTKMGKVNTKIPGPDAMHNAFKLAVLKDKLIFHKAAVAVLKDVLGDIENE